MSKLSFAALSLIGAVPGGYLLFRLIMAIPHFREMVGMMRVVYCLILALSAVVAVIPIGILIFVKEEKAGPAKGEETETEAEAEEVAAEEVAEVGDDAEVHADELDESTKVEAFDTFDEEFAETEEEPEPEPAGKKKKKKKKK